MKMEEPQNTSFEQSKILKNFYKPDYSGLFNKIKDIKTPVKNEILMTLLDGNRHTELDLIRVAKQKMRYFGAVTLGTMIHSLNNHLKNDYVEKNMINGKLSYRISDNYVGLTRAAYNKYRITMD